MDIETTLQRSALNGLELTLNRLLDMDPGISSRLAALDGKLVEIHVRGLKFRLYMTISGSGIYLQPDSGRPPDTTIAGTPLGLMRGGLGDQSRMSLFAGDMEISGDAETGRALKSILDDLDIDWEEQLSHLVGDVASHQIGNLVRGLRARSSEAAEALRRNLGDYLHEETRLLPNRYEVERFLRSVDVLRADTDRLEQRLKRLEEAARPADAAQPKNQN